MKVLKKFLLKPTAGIRSIPSVVCRSLLLAMVAACGCALPAVRMTVEVRDQFNHVKTRFDKTSTDSGPTTLVVSRTDKVFFTALAEFDKGLESLSVTSSVICTLTAGGLQNSNQFSSTYPSPVGNAIPAGQAPPKYSFTGSFIMGNECNRPEVSLELQAITRSVPYGSGPATVYTQPVIFNY